MKKRYFEYGDIRYELKHNMHNIHMYLWDTDPDTYMFQWMLVELIKCDTREEAEETFYGLAKIFKVEDIVKL